MQAIASAPLRDDGLLGSRAAVAEWVAAGASRSTAESALTSGAYEVGAFCLRMGSAGSNLVLSVLARPGTVVHFRTVRGADGCLTVPDAMVDDTGRKFADIHAVVAHFTSNRLSSKVPCLVGCIPPPGSNSGGGSGMYAAPSSVDATSAYATPASIVRGASLAGVYGAGAMDGGDTGGQPTYHVQPGTGAAGHDTVTYAIPFADEGEEQAGEQLDSFDSFEA